MGEEDSGVFGDEEAARIVAGVCGERGGLVGAETGGEAADGGGGRRRGVEHFDL